MKLIKQTGNGRNLLCAVVCLLLSNIAAQAHDFEVDGIYYNQLTDTTVEVTYRWESYSAYSNEYDGDVVIPSEIVYDNTTYSVTTIGGSAFRDCIGLSSITIPNSVTTIGMSAFSGCTELSSITIPNSVTTIGGSAFSGCTGLSSIAIPNSVTTIGGSAFSGCTGLSSIAIPNSVATIGEYTFDGCTGMNSITIPNSVTTIGRAAFSGCKGLSSITIPNSVTTIGNYAFDGCTRIKELTIEDGAETLSLASNGSYTGLFYYCPLEKLYLGRNLSYTSTRGYSPFSGQTALTSVVIGNSVMTIGEYAFNGCKRLSSITIPNSVTTIGSSAFRDCIGLSSITLGNSVTTIGSSAFFGCTGLSSITIPNSVTTIGSSAFRDCIGLSSITIPNSVTTIGSSAFEGCTVMSSITLGNSVTTIGSSAFSGCTGLSSITIPNSVTTIGSSAFSGCTGMSSITIPNSVTTIGGYAFEGCTVMSSITLGNSVRTIGEYAFSDCIGLSSITIPNSVTSIGNYAFEDCIGIKELTIEDGDETLNLGYNGYKKGLFYDCPLEKLYLGRNLSYNTSYGYSPFYGKTALTSVVIGNSVMTIGEYAFDGCKGLSSITIPNSVTTIGNSAFDGCTGIKELTIEDGTKTLSLGYNGSKEGLFYDCPLEKLYLGRNLSYSTSYGYSPFYGKTALTSVVIGNSVMTIGEYAFDGCKGLSSITIPNSVTTIGDYAFEGCTGIKELAIEDGEETLNLGYNGYKKGLFYDCPLEKLYLGRNLSYNNSYGYSPFYGKTALTSVVIGNSVMTIGEYAFNGCKGLSSITIPNSVTSIGNSAFDGCTGIKELTIEDGDETLSVGSNGSYRGLFYDCPLEELYLGRNLSYNNSYGYSPFFKNTALTSVVIGNSVMTIGEHAFSGCTGMSSITLGNSVTTIGEYAFRDCIGLSSITIPNSVTTIGGSAFSGCTGMSSIAIPNSVATIGSSVFSGCTGLSSITLGDSVTTIGEHAFSGCTGLSSITIPNSVTTIGNYAFFGCTGIKELTIVDGEETLSLGDNGSNKGLFYDCPLEKLYLGRNLSYNNSYGYSPFFGKTALTSVVIGNSVTTIGEYAFDGCTGISSITIPNSVTTIWQCAFSGCTGLTGVYISDADAWCKIYFSTPSSNPLSYAGNLYLNDELVEHVEFPESINEVNYHVFYNCKSLKSVSIPASVTSIESRAFSGCTGLSSITIPNSVTTIGNSAFDGCTGIKELTIEDGAETLSLGDNGSNKSLFYDCPLEKLYLGRILSYSSSYGHSPFSGKTALTSVVIGNSVTTIESSAFDGCTGLSSITIPNSVTSIGNYAFEGCTGLTGVYISDADAWCKIYFSTPSSNPLSFAGNLYLNDELVEHVEFPERINKVKPYVFYNCKSLKGVSIPASVNSIGSRAFYGTSLKEVFLPARVTSVGEEAFGNCSLIEKVVSLNTTPPTIKSSTFDSDVEATATLHVQRGSLVHYRLDPVWKEFANMADDVISLDAIPDATYGDGEIDLAQYAPTGVALTYETSNDDVVQIDGTKMRIVGAGTATVRALLAEDGEPMEIMGQMRQFNVEQADLTMSVEDIEITSGNPLPEFTYVADGLVYDDTIADIEELPIPVCDVDENTPAGEYEVTFTEGHDRNYRIATIPAKVIVVKAQDGGLSKVVAEEESVTVYDLQGVLIYSGRATDAHLEKGVYIVKQGTKAYKVYVN